MPQILMPGAQRRAQKVGRELRSGELGEPLLSQRIKGRHPEEVWRGGLIPANWVEAPPLCQICSPAVALPGSD